MKNSNNRKVLAVEQTVKEFIQTEVAQTVEERLREHHCGQPWPDRMCKTGEVTDVTGLSRAQIFRLVNAGAFPPPIRLSEARIAWPASVIRRWLADRIGKHAGTSQSDS